MKKKIILFLVLILSMGIFSGCKQSDKEILAQVDSTIIQKYNELFPEMTEKTCVVAIQDYYNSAEYDRTIEDKYKILKRFIEVKYKDNVELQNKLESILKTKIEDYKKYEREESKQYIDKYNLNVQNEIDKINVNAGIKPEPSIGMTKEEILFSSWGSPVEKNILDSNSGTSEQWVYSLDKYIYFEDGLVTAIQKSE